MWLPRPTTGDAYYPTYIQHAQRLNPQGSLRQTVGILLSYPIITIRRSWLRLTNTYPIISPVSLRAILKSYQSYSSLLWGHPISPNNTGQE